MISVAWMKCGNNGHYCDLELLDLNSITAKGGVYVIWHEGNPRDTLLVEIFEHWIEPAAAGTEGAR